MFGGAGFIPSQISLDLVNAERAARDQLYAANYQNYQTQLKAYNTLESQLDGLADKLSAISGDSFNAKSVSVIGDQISAAVAGNAPVGNYDVVVSRLAQAEQLSKTFSGEDEALPTSGVLNIQLGSDPADAISIDLSAENADGSKTVADLRDMINKHPDNPGAQASLVRTGDHVELMMTSKDTGSENTLDVTLDGADWGMTQLKAAQDAKFSINGLAVTSSSNFIDDVIDGISIELDKVHASGESSVIKVEADTETAKQSVQDFVDAYNELLDQLDSLTKGFGSAATDSESETLGVLNGDASVRMLEGKLKDVLFDTAPGGQRLSDIGIELDRYGKLSVDNTKLSNVLRDDPDTVQALFTADDGYIDKLEQVLEPYTEFNGYIDNRQTNLKERSDRVEYDMEQYNIQMEQKYQLYLAQFTAAEAAINSMNAASSLFNTGA